MINKNPDIEAEITLLSTAEGGKKRYTISGYRADHLIKPDYLTCAQHEYIDTEKLHPGNTAKATVKFITPEVYPHTLWVGRVINVQEGPKVVGHLKVTKILNPILEKE